ncbi:MAG: Peptidase rane alanine aminopeptidase, partial [Acidobacteria bacterium]|nr:Peptidase rane alanine aminopeptidase [Acidobacteriota bacterium]
MLQRFLIFAFVFAFVLIMTTSIFPQTPTIEPGVSQTLAKWRAANYSDVRYKLNITLEKGAPLMKGDIEIRVKLTDEGAKNDLILDWRTTQFANDKDKPFANVVAVNDAPDVLHSIINEHITIPKALLKTGENLIKINFASPIKTSGAAITRYVDKEDGAEYIYSLFVPSDASTAFPVFDQPDLKARFKLTINTLEDWKVISNSEVERVWIASNVLREKNIKGQFGEKRHHHIFKETKPISTYVFAFAAGDFVEFPLRDKVEVGDIRKAIDDAIIKGELSHSTFTVVENNESVAKAEIPLQTKVYVRKSQAEKFKQHSAEVFRLNREGVKFLENYFDYKFPFPKYDLVLIPEFPFGGMEHAGATFLRESSVIFPTEPTKNDYVSRANVIFHEAAHQWFGDTVTMKWFDDLWLKEGFAEFMAYKTLEKVMPEYNAWKIFYERNKQAAYLTDATKGTTPIYQEIPNLSAAKSAYGNIVYRKAPSFLKQAEFYLGEKEFQTAVRAFLKKHEFANAEWTDLVKEFEIAGKQELKDWAETWVKQRGLFKYQITVNKTLSKEVKAQVCCFGVLSEKHALDSDLPLNQSKFKILETKYKVL